MPVSKNVIPLRPRESCPLCGHREYGVHIELAAISIARCPACNFMFSGATMDGQAMARFYTESYGGLRHRQGQQVNARVNQRAIRRLIKLERGGRVLEVGSGFGFLLRALARSCGVAPIGIELSQEEAEYSRRVNGVETFDVALERSAVAIESFDLVACFETIEHVPEPVEFIRLLTRYVKPGGALLIMTDNFESKVVRRMGASFPKWIPHQHVCHFTAETLPRAIENERSLSIEKVLSFTPWELAARALLTANDDNARGNFDLERELSTEMTRGYRFYGLRRLVNQLWAQWTFREDLEGELMYVLARKGASSSAMSVAA